MVASENWRKHCPFSLSPYFFFPDGPVLKGCIERNSVEKKDWRGSSKQSTAFVIKP